jgi:ketosteroid isomerase-like protein
VTGRAAIEKFHKDFAQQFMVHGMTITSQKTHVAGDIAYDVGTYKQQLMPMKGGNVIDDHGKYVVLLKKEGGNWLVTHAIYNSDLPVPTPPAPAKK